MSDIINIVIHPGYCSKQDNYNKEIYFEQLDKGLVNIFLHPTLSKRQMEFLLNKEFSITKNYALKCLNINNAIINSMDRDYINNEGKYIRHPYVGNILRQFMFSVTRRVKKNKNIKNKKFSKYFKKILNKKQKNLVKYLILLSTKGYPFFVNHLTGKEYDNFRTLLKEKYSKNNTVNGREQINFHVDATLITPNTKNLIKYVKENIEVEDKVFLFGEHFNQCVQNIANVMDEIGLEYKILKSLTSYNNSPDLEKCSNPDEHFFVLEK